MTPSVSEPSHPNGEQEPGAIAPAAPRRRPKVVLLLPLLLLLGLAGWALWRFWPRPDTGILELSGRIEGYPTDVDAKVSGRIEGVTVREGERVQQGQLLATLDEAELKAQLEGAQARLRAAKDREQQARLQLGVIQNQIQEVQLTREQATGESAGRVSQAEGNLAAAESGYAEAQAQLRQAQSQLTLARTDRDRTAALYQQGAVSRQQLDQAQTAFETAQQVTSSREAALQAAQRQIKAAAGGLTQAQSSGLNPNIRNAQIATLQQQLGVARAQVTTAQAEVASAQAAVQEASARLSNLQILSPIDGVVQTRSIEPGTVVSPGTTLLTLINADDVYLRGFIPEQEIGQIRVGQSARVYLDSHPEQPLAAKVRAVDATASFTPENVYFKEDRVRQVFGVELTIENPAG
ncbi:MAG TPA: HlyD family efflux transporter periplasmic adaptor subunit, partial [Leptolyngbyaceae cyanobacterium]